MMRLEMKNYSIILTEKEPKYQLYHRLRTNSEKISVQLFLDNFGTLIPKILVIFYKNDF